MEEKSHFYNTLLIISGYFPTLLWVAPIFNLFTKWKRLNKVFKSFFYFALIMFLINLLVQGFLWSASEHYSFWKPYLDYWHIENVLFTRIIFHISCFIFIGYCYFTIIPLYFLNKYKFLIISVLCILSTVIYIFIDNYQGYGTIGQNLYHFFLVSTTLVYLSYLFKLRPNNNITKVPFFWISFGFLIPNAVTLIFQITAQNLYDNDFVLYCQIYIFGNAIEMIGIILMLVGLRKI